MKWYNVKKYNAPECVSLFLNINHINNGYQIFSGFVDDGIYVSDETGKILKNVTHFCIPDPIEIEE